MKYLRLLRLEDHYIIFGVAIAAGLCLKLRTWPIFWWGMAAICISICAFMVNEFVDREDCDQHSWNPIHMKKDEKYNPVIVAGLFIFFTSVTFIIVFLTGLLWWALAVYVVSILYSVKPVRLKARFGLDMLAQLLSAAIPFIAAGAMYGRAAELIPYIVVFAFLMWAEVFPYQLADFSADKKAGLKNTHVVIGMKNSLILGFLFGIAGIMLYFIWNYHRSIPWALIFVIIDIYILFRYILWFRMPSVAKQTASMQSYIRFIKPVAFLIVPYLIIVWFLV